ncbi:MAG TPA: tetratricopeptide repeat protein [Thermoanaerobaculia bacterium]
MRFGLRAAAVLALVLGLSTPLRAEEGILVVHVEDVKGNPVSGVTLAPKGDGAAGAPTDKLGKTRLRLAPATKSGHWVTLQIIPKKGGPDWVFVSPWNQRALVPSFANDSENFVEVVLGERGNRDLLASDQAIKAMAARTLEQLSPKLDKSEITEEERKRVLAEQAANFGMKPEEVDKAIRAWGAKVRDPYDVGLAALYERNYPEAEKSFERSLVIRREKLGEAQVEVAEAAFFLGQVLFAQGKYSKAALSYRESLELAGESVVGLNSLGVALLESGEFRDARYALERCLELSEQNAGTENLVLATHLNNLAQLDRAQGRYSEAESKHQRALKIREDFLGAEHPDVALSLNNLALLYHSMGRYVEAEPLYKRSLSIWGKIQDSERDIALGLNNLALLYHSQNRYAEAEPLYKRSLEIWEKTQGPEHPDVATSLNNLAGLYGDQGRFLEAEPLHKRSIKIAEKSLGEKHVEVARSLNNLAELYRLQQRYAEAETLQLRSLRIREEVLGAEHPDVAISLNNLALIYDNQGRYSDAEPYIKNLL